MEYNVGCMAYVIKRILDNLKFDDNEFITFSTVTKKGRTEVLSIIEEKI